MDPEPKVLPPGTILDGRFEIGQVLGFGGMAVVYDAKQLTLFNRPVAVKVLDPDLASDDSYRKRFAREAGLVAALVHEHIVPVHDYGDGDGHLYLAMQKVEGTTLAQRLRRGPPLAGAEALEVLGAVADALDYAHGLGLLHRDIKPENILLQRRGDRGNVLLADFGIARGVGGTAHTATGGVLGTLRYASPEQLQGHDVGPATDLYSLAVVAYEALTGAPGPYLANSDVRYLAAHLNARPVPLGPADDAAADAVFEVLSWGLEKQPDVRPPTATAFVEALAEVMSPRAEVLTRAPAFLQNRPDAAPAALDGWADALEGDAEQTGPAETVELGAKVVTADRLSATRPWSTVGRYWPALAAALALILPVRSVLGSQRQQAPRLSSGAASVRPPTGLSRASSQAAVASAVLPHVRGQTLIGLGSPEAGAALITREAGQTALAPATTASRASTGSVRLAGGFARRYTTASGTIFVGQTHDEVIWLGCSTSLRTCSDLAASLVVKGAQFEADPLPAVATTLSAATRAINDVRRRLSLPAGDRGRRAHRARLIAAGYRLQARRLQGLADQRPRDRDIAELESATHDGAIAFTHLASAAAASDLARDRSARTELTRSDASFRGALVALSSRGYRTAGL